MATQWRSVPSLLQKKLMTAVNYRLPKENYNRTEKSTVTGRFSPWYSSVFRFLTCLSVVLDTKFELVSLLFYFLNLYYADQQLGRCTCELEWSTVPLNRVSEAKK